MNWALRSTIQTNLSSCGLAGLRILFIAFTDYVLKWDSSISTFQVLVAWLIKQATTRGLWSVEVFIGVGVKFGSQRIHGSFQMSIKVASPTKKHTPFVISFFIGSMAFQVCDGFLQGSRSIQSFLTLYLLLKAWIHRFSLLDTTIQVSFAKLKECRSQHNARLKMYRSRNPTPPSFYEIQSLFQLNQCIFRSKPRCPLQKLLILEFNSAQKLFSWDNNSLQRLGRIEQQPSIELPSPLEREISLSNHVVFSPLAP